MATFTVNTTADVVDGNNSELSLREAVTQANATAAADTIVFASGLEGKTLVLTGGELLVNRNLTIQGDSNADGVRVTLDGGHSSRLLDIHANTSNGFQSTNVTLSGFNLANGEAEQDQNGGGDIFCWRRNSIYQ